MSILNRWFGRQIAICLAILLAAPFGQAATPQTSMTQQGKQVQAQTGEPASQASSAGQTQDIPDNPTPSSSATSGGNQQAALQQQPQDQQQNGAREPVGTAAAPYEKPLGVPASRPAGAAIAPAKQKRRSSIGIKLGLLIATGVAVGTVVGLSSASSSRPH